MEEFNIRSPEEHDFLKIAEIAPKCLPMVTEKNSIYHLFTKFFKNTSLVVETAEDEIIGFLLGFISQENPQDAYIHLLCVSPEFRKKGLAKALIWKFLDIVRMKGCYRTYLITKPENLTAIEFYKRLGFKFDGEGEKIQINGVNAVKDYNGFGDHRVVFCKLLD
jgi:ribosomal protein S18 acetylase RimI-like enzyme